MLRWTTRVLGLLLITAGVAFYFIANVDAQVAQFGMGSSYAVWPVLGLIFVGIILIWMSFQPENTPSR
jgi:hypothetical protein